MNTATSIETGSLRRQDIIDYEPLLKTALKAIIPFSSYSLVFPARTPEEMEADPQHPFGRATLENDRLALPLIARLRAEGFVTGDNQPYDGHLDGDAIDRHALRHGRPNVLIELRNDLIGDVDAQALWAARLAPILEDVLAASGL